MPHFTFEQPIRQLEKQKGGYFYLKINADIVNKYEKQRAARLKCVIDQKVSYSCGLNHFGDGDYFIIVATRHLKSIGKELNDIVSFEIFEDPNPLGVEIPKVLEVLQEQDEEIKELFNNLTDGKKRSLIYSINSVKDIDKQVQKILTFLNQQKSRSR